MMPKPRGAAVATELVGVSRCFVLADKAVQWPTNSGRGKWCRGCYTCWRTNHSGAHTLVLFGRFSKHPQNYQTWEDPLIAYVGLRVDGSERITSP